MNGCRLQKANQRKKIYTVRGTFRSQNFVPDSIECSWYVYCYTIGFTETPKSSGLKVGVNWKLFTEAMMAIWDKSRRFKPFPNFCLRDKFESFDKSDRTMAGKLRGLLNSSAQAGWTSQALSVYDWLALNTRTLFCLPGGIAHTFFSFVKSALENKFQKTFANFITAENITAFL